jgi:hypothetical protein
MTQYIPAQPGFFVLYPDDKGKPIDEVIKIPIVAWKIVEREDGDYHSDALPVCIESIYDFNSLYILTPDGQVYEPDSTWWQNIESWSKPDVNK